MLRWAIPVVTLAAASSLGCASSLQPPAIASDAPLGRVIIYRNGVAYFERYAEIDEGKLTLQVPPERVDDFLKSLAIVDVQSGEAMPVSYPTLDSLGGDTSMTITLPGGHHRLKISYVTESPAWKPTYRVILGEGDAARLQGWAVVDNVSGEDWDHIQIGVGSTSALSFRYDLHSVQLVDRETLSSGSLLAVAPPSGGSPYAVASRRVRVVGGLTQEAFNARNAVSETTVASMEPEADYGYDFSDDDAGEGRGPASKVAKGAHRVTVAELERQVSNLKEQVQRSHARLRIEGFANASDGDRMQASLARANAMRDELVAGGVDSNRIDVVATGKLSNEAVRVVETGEDGRGEGQPQPEQADDGQPIGSAHFLSQSTMNIARDHSAMVGIVNAETQAERIYFYDPVSERGSSEYAFNAVRIFNPSEFMLDSGPFTVYMKGQFLGEGLSEPILPKSTAFIPYALDRSIIVDTGLDTREEIDKLLTIQRGIVATETRRIRRTKLTITNRNADDAEVYVRHMVQQGFELLTSKEAQGKDVTPVKVEKMGGAHLFPVTVKGHEALELVIEEWTPIMKTVDINTGMGIDQMALYLRSASALDPVLKEKLDKVVKTHTTAADLEQKIQLLREQMGVYRTRVDELDMQLADLRKVPQAEKLRKHLAEKMSEISERLQKATLDTAELQGSLMTKRIELQDELADLTLTQKKREAEKAAAAAKGDA